MSWIDKEEAMRLLVLEYMKNGEKFSNARSLASSVLFTLVNDWYWDADEGYELGAVEAEILKINYFDIINYPRHRVLN